MLLRTLVFVTAVLLTTIPADAQVAPPAACQGTSPIAVVVTPATGQPIRGTLLCLTGDQLVLARDGHVTATDLATVRRIETPPDPVWDGVLKGAAIPFIGWLIFSEGAGAGWMLRSVAAYGSIGFVLDGLDRNQTRIYDGGRRAAVGWRIRF